METKGVVALALVALLAGLVAGLPAGAASGTGGSSGSPAATSSITLLATADYQYQPDTFEQVATGTTITVTFTDVDDLPHSFTISSREGFVIPTTYDPTQLNELFVTYPALYSSLLNGSGDRSVGTFESPSVPGWYEFVCNVSGHFQNGMYGFIAFGENLPKNLTVPNRTGIGGGTLSPIEAIGIGVGVILVLALGYFVWLRRQARAKQPPTSGRRG